MKFELERAIKAFNLEFHFVRGRMQNKQSRRLVPKLAETQRAQVSKLSLQKWLRYISHGSEKMLLFQFLLSVRV